MGEQKPNNFYNITSNILEEIDAGKQSLDGKVEVKNGIVYITNPQAGGKFPVIHGDKNLIILVNGVEISEPTVVSASDKVQVLGKRKEPLSSFKIEVTTDKMQAFLTTVKSKGEIYQPLDLKPVTEAFIKSQLSESVEPPSIKEIDVLNELKEQGIIFGTNQLAIREAITEASGKTVVVAEGNPVIHGKDGKITYLFPTQSNAHSTVLSNEERVNYFNRPQIKSVNIGEVIAIKKPVQPGIPGKNILGEEILPKDPKENELRHNRGVELKENGTVAVATCNGRPVLEGRLKNILSVLPLYVVEGDVDVHTGNINFKGDILIKGAVCEGLKVTAGGTVEVFKDVNGTINATGNVIVHGNIIHAVIRAGGQTTLYHQVAPVLKEIEGILKKLYSTVLQVKNHTSFKTADLVQQGDGKLIKLLIDTRYSNFNKLLAD